ncbi:RBBP9/YdeN family alpha/beta hydrolase [Blastomonas sp.]|uniref:RBBP9/YdeN family alpha/beta hydrolase n=1 Tax=Blastomonas sp. TaxID=1909299 RepID=UPI00359457EC
MPGIHARDHQDPTILTVPGLDNSCSAHWQALWEQQWLNCHRVDMGNWQTPNSNAWVNRLNLAIRQTAGPIILVAHSLGCHAVAWWAALERPTTSGPVVGALLVAPPEVDSAPADPRLNAFAPSARGVLPFPSIVVGSRNDPYITPDRAYRLASLWGADHVDAGRIGHINSKSDIGDWAFGKSLLARLLDAVEPIRKGMDDAAHLPRPGATDRRADLSQ